MRIICRPWRSELEYLSIDTRCISTRASPRLFIDANTLDIDARAARESDTVRVLAGDVVSSVGKVKKVVYLVSQQSPDEKAQRLTAAEFVRASGHWTLLLCRYFFVEFCFVNMGILKQIKKMTATAYGLCICEILKIYFKYSFLIVFV